ncbi:MAG: AAA family ATPase [Gemmobacter sp.]|nr:AAA family ATPase [Gemmobacter sp.]
MNVFADMNRRLSGGDPFDELQPDRSADDGCPPPLPDEAYAPFTEPGETDAAPREPPGGNGKPAPRVIRPEPDRASTFFSAATLQGCEVPERQWLVPELVPCRSVTLLYGDGGTGKSLLALQLAACVATGRRWLGRDTAAGKAVFLSAEDEKDELHRRLADIARHEAIELADMDKLTLRSLAGEDAILARQEGPSAPLAELCLNLGDAHSQAARFSVSTVTSTPSLNLIPSITFGN